MKQAINLGQIIILNGTPRSGKTSIATVIQETFDGPWINLGVDGYKRMTPKTLWTSDRVASPAGSFPNSNPPLLCSTPPCMTPSPRIADWG